MKPLIGLCLVSIILFSGSCCDKDCFEDPNLVAPPYVTGLFKLYTPDPIYIGQVFYPYGQEIRVYNAINRFFSVQRPDVNGNIITYYWNDQTPPPFSHLDEDEEVTMYVVIFNNKVGNFDCIFEEAQIIESELRVRYRVENQQVVGVQKVIETQYKVPAGNYAIFEFPFLYRGDGNYDLNITFSSEGLSEIDTTDNNYSVSLSNLMTR